MLDDTDDQEGGENAQINSDPHTNGDTHFNNNALINCDILELNKTNCVAFDVDDAWTSLHRFGRFQVIQFILLTLISLPLSFAILGGVFVGRDVIPQCWNEVNFTNTLEANETVEWGTCEITIWANSSGGRTRVREESCSEYRFDSDEPVSFLSEWGFVCEHEALGQLPQMMTMLGMMTGAGLLPPIGDRFGRRPLMFGSCIASGAVMLAMAYIPHFEVFLFFKFLSGSFNQGVMVPYFILMIEAFPTELRLGVAFCSFVHWVISMLTIVPLAYYLQDHNWRSLQMTYGIGCCLAVIPAYFVDESLRWLLVSKRVEEATKVLKKACTMNGINYETVIHSALQKHADEHPAGELNHDGTHEEADEITLVKQKKSKATIFDVLKNSVLRRMSLSMCYGWLIVCLTYYGITFLSTSLAGNAYVNYSLSAALELPANIVICTVIKRIGRKRTLISFTTAAAVTLLVAVLLATLAEKTEAIQMTQTALTLAGKFFITGSFNNLWLYTPELYPTDLRNVGIGISSTSARIGATTSPFFRLLAKKAVWAPGALFAAGSFLAVYLFMYLPETGWRELPQTVEEVEGWFKSDKADEKTKTATGADKPGIKFSAIDDKNKIV